MRKHYSEVKVVITDAFSNGQEHFKEGLEE